MTTGMNAEAASRARRWIMLCVLMAVAGLGVRTWHLDRRPLHHDEANQAVKFGRLLDGGQYRYDPDEHHGPTLYYLTVPVAHLFGQRAFCDVTEITLRLLPTVVGALTILLTIGLFDAIGWPAVAAACAFMSFSPSLVYYSGYFIQESFLVFFGMLTLVCGWRYMRSHGTGWLLVAGAGLGLMHATKETWVLTVAAWAGAWVLAWLLSGHRLTLPHRAWRSVLAAFVVAMLVSVILYSSCFLHWGGVLDSWSTYLTYLERGGGTETEHVHPWFYYLKILWGGLPGRGLWWTEAWVLLCAAGACMPACIWLKRSKDAFGPWFVLMYAGLITAIYAIIPYKTPWCMMTSVHALCLAAGVGVGLLWQRWRVIPVRAGLVVVVAAAVAHLGVQAVRATGRYSADERNPYVYAHTTMDYLRMVQRIEEIADHSGLGRELTVWSLTGPHEAWPLPWYLRGYAHVGYWTDPQGLPQSAHPDIWVVGPEYAEALEARLGDDYVSEFYSVRPEVLLQLFIRSDLWAAFLESRK